MCSPFQRHLEWLDLVGLDSDQSSWWSSRLSESAGRGRLSDTYERTTREQNDRLFSIDTRRLILDIRRMPMRADIPGDRLEVTRKR